MSDDWLPAWKEASRVLGLAFDDRWPVRMHGRIDAVEITCQVGYVDLTRGQLGYASSTTATAKPPSLPRGLRLSIARGYIYPLGRAFLQDIRTGDAEFDDRFIIKGSDEELVRLWLSAPLREHVGIAEDWTFKLQAGEAAAWVGRPESSKGVLVAAVRGLIALAGRGLELGGELDRLAAGIGGRREAGGWDGASGRPIEHETEGTRFRVEHLHGRFGNRRAAPVVLHTRVACPRYEGATRHFLLARHRHAKGFGGAGRIVTLPDEWLSEKYVARAEDADHLRARLTPAVRALLARTLPDAIIVADEVSVWSQGLTLTAPGVTALVEVAAALAPEPLAVGSGPYR